MKGYVENVKEYEEICQFIGFDTPIPTTKVSGTWKIFTPELPPRFWDLEKF